jgi:short-subunit dehydrogenase
VAAVEGLGLRVDLLVNDAGFGSEGRFQRLDHGHEVAIVRTCAEAVVALCGAWVPSMVERGAGAVLNVASTAAFQPVPNMATYGAAKAFVLSFTEALGQDLHGTGVSATALCPGPVDTEFVKATERPGGAVSRAPGWATLGSEETARAGVEGVLAGRRTVVPGRLQAAGALVGRLAPRGALLPVLRRFYPSPR